MSARVDDLVAKLRAKVLPPPDVCRSIRIASGATQDEVAEAIGVDRATVSRWESGSRSPRGDIRRRYAEVVDVLSIYWEAP